MEVGAGLCVLSSTDCVNLKARAAQSRTVHTSRSLTPRPQLASTSLARPAVVGAIILLSSAKRVGSPSTTPTTLVRDTRPTHQTLTSATCAWCLERVDSKIYSRFAPTATIPLGPCSYSAAYANATSVPLCGNPGGSF